MFLLINKPAGWTSFDVVAYIRKQHPKKTKVGHAGTLDPFATGLLIVAIGREATKKLDEFKNLPKTYIATIKLGEISDTFDKTGKIKKYKKNIIEKIFKKNINKEIVNNILKKFIGKQKQLPPMFSAKKINGQRLYELARQGKTIKRQKNKIEIFEIKLLEYNYPYLKIEIICSAGTYIRTLANDIGKNLGTGAYCEELTRTAIGPHSLSEAEQITK